MWSGPGPGSILVSLGLILATTLRLGGLIIPNLHTRTSGSKQRSDALEISPLARSRGKVYSQVCVHRLGPMGRKEAGKSLDFQMSQDCGTRGDGSSFCLGWDFPQPWTIASACTPPWLGNSPPNIRINSKATQGPWEMPKPACSSSYWQQYLCGAHFFANMGAESSGLLISKE